MIYALSDIHGYQAAFDQILSMIDLQPEDHLYIIGDVVDRGPHGIELLQRIREMPNITLMLGNHEYMMINRLRNPDDWDLMRLWYKNGGRETEEQFKALDTDEKESILSYLEGLPVQLDVPVGGTNYLLVHACPTELFEQYTGWYENETEFAVWKRIDGFTSLPEGKTVIFGHTPTINLQETEDKMRIFHTERRIGIDCGCAYPDLGGQLACLRLDDLKEFYSDEKDVSKDHDGKQAAETAPGP